VKLLTIERGNRLMSITASSLLMHTRLLCLFIVSMKKLFNKIAPFRNLTLKTKRNNKNILMHFDICAL
jgi:hypothetical protein